MINAGKTWNSFPGVSLVITPLIIRIKKTHKLAGKLSARLLKSGLDSRWFSFDLL